MSENNDRQSRNEIFSGPGTSPMMPKSNVMKDDFGFEIPVESVPLPSKGVVYDTDSPLYGCDTVEIRAMTAREEDILTSKALIKKGTVITHLLESCLIDKRIKTNEMLAEENKREVELSL